MPVFLIAAAAAAPELSAAAIAAIAAGSTAATGGIYYYRQEIYNQYMSLFTSGANKLTSDELNLMKTDHAETQMRQEQPMIMTKAAVEAAITHVETVVAQTSQQQTCIEGAVQQFTETRINAQDATQTLDNLTQPLHLAAMTIANSVDVIENELSYVNENMATAAAALNASTLALSSVAKQLGETDTKLSSSLAQLTTDTSNADSGRTRQQQHVRDAVTAVHHDDEAADMRKKIHTLSIRFFAVLKENSALMTENIALKMELAMPKK